jgi:NADPH-dependent 2,4-dienoyl-CoA reductase/sulfur reductase-like enzyme
VEPLSVSGIREIVRKFGDAADRALAAGFEMIEIHGAHGYLINQFLSPFSNIREDEYGGDLERRCRFALEVIEEVRRRIGPDFPLSWKISAQEFVPGGLTVEESIQILRRLVEAGVDIVQVSAGNDATPEWISQPMFMPKACLADSAAEIKKALDIPVMAVGRINDPLTADRLVAEGSADLVCIGRGLLADPKMPLKAQQGRLDDIRTCIACNTCMESIFRKGRVECMVNPTLGRETEMTLTPADPVKKVMVVGGGPGGLNVAWVAAKRGHQVHLYERARVLGGQLLLGAMTTYKKELLTLIEYQKKQIEKYGVHCHLGCEVSVATIAEVNPDVLVLATGAVPDPPQVPGMDRPIVKDVSEIFREASPDSNHKTVVVGGGATGCEVALHLAEAGWPVTIVEKLPRIGAQMESVTRKVILQKLNDLGVEIIPRTGLVRIEDSGAVVAGRDEEERLIECSRVVVVTGNRPDNTLYEEVKGMGIPIYQIGDCLEPRSAKAAIYEGALIGRRI